MAAQVTKSRGVGIMRHLNDWQILRLRKMSKGRNHNIAPMAFGLDMTIQQFKPLAPEQKRLAWHAPHSAPGTPGGGWRTRAGSPTRRLRFMRAAKAASQKEPAAAG
jgi:hypothetical protein